ncbi:hypothetical protein BGY98DRAFT_936096 [Russula aff. rugulosa BPL654]|nr:hypothetical protein BGY98DRAFT_936096 [Russula aff. rugulosa BPL654]
MFSLVKLALFSLIAFATLALAIPSPANPLNDPDPRGLIAKARTAVAETVVPLNYVDSFNGTSGCIPVLQEVAVIVRELTWALKGLNLVGCGCTYDIIALIADLLKTIFEAIDVLQGSVSDLEPLLGDLVAAVVELLNVVLALVGGLVGELLILLIGNGCAGILLKLKLSVLSVLINLLGLGGLLG